jgi:hypothetical protein
MAIIRLDNYNICFYPHRTQVYESHTELLCRTRENSGADVTIYLVVVLVLK